MRFVEIRRGEEHGEGQRIPTPLTSTSLSGLHARILLKIDMSLRRGENVPNGNPLGFVVVGKWAFS